MMDSSPGYHGKIVAFEGSPEVVSTQLQLLPSSPEILILPSIQTYIATKTDDKPFDAHSFIRSAHDASVTRREKALEFLQHSTPARKRIVFLNGGTVSAYTLCITTIRQHYDLQTQKQAEEKFEELIRHGLAGLSTSPSSPVSANSPQGDRHLGDRKTSEMEDASTRAMREAERLDRETESLQPSSLLDLDAQFRPRSASLPINILESQPSIEDVVSTIGVAPLAERFRFLETNSTFHATVTSPASMEEFRMSTCSSILATYAYSPNYNLPCLLSDVNCLSPLFEVPSASPTSPSKTVIGQAEVFDMASLADKSPLRRSLSFDGALPTKGRALEQRALTGALNSLTFCHKSRELEDNRLYSWLGAPNPRVPSTRPRPTHLDLRRAVMCNAGQTTISQSNLSGHQGFCSTYVDRGTDPIGISEEEDSAARSNDHSTTGPVLPLVEDLIIHLSGKVCRAVFQSVMQAFRVGIYPIVPLTQDASHKDAQLSTTMLFPAPLVPKELGITSPAYVSDEYDPYRPQSTCVDGQSLKFPTMPPPPRIDPPTPAQTPPPSSGHAKIKVRVLPASRYKEAVSTQNALRAELALHFPSKEYNSRQMPLMFPPGLNDLWRPLLCGAFESNRNRPGSADSTFTDQENQLDLILAFGADEEVKKDFCASVTEQLSRLGNVTTPGVTAKSCCLDLRYLIANALLLHASSAPHSDKEVDNDALVDPTLLAALLIPGLDLYLLSHPDARFLLLEFPQDHLATVMALQTLLGEDLVKVAAITAGRQLPRRPDSTSAGASPSQALKSFTSASSALSLASHANLVLSAAANDTEVALFVSDVWKTLVSASDLYTLDRVPKYGGVIKQSRASLTARKGATTCSPSLDDRRNRPFSGSFDSAFGSALSQSESALPVPMSRHNNAAGRRRREGSPSPSMASSVRTVRSRAVPRRTTSVGAESILEYYDPAQDSDYDVEERRLMPLYLTRGRVPRKGNTQKALKWLGLA